MKQFLLGIGIGAIVIFGMALYPVWPKSTISTTTQCVAITGSSQQYTLPTTGAYFYIKVKDNNVYLKEGSNPTATVTVGTGHGIALTDGDLWGPVRLNGPKVALISDSAGGEVCFVPLYGTTQ